MPNTEAPRTAAQQAAMFCRLHRDESHEEVRNKRCEKCAATARFGDRATHAAKFCARHAGPANEDLRSKRCEARGCARQPFFGARDERVARCTAPPRESRSDLARPLALLDSRRLAISLPLKARPRAGSARRMQGQDTQTCALASARRRSVGGSRHSATRKTPRRGAVLATCRSRSGPALVEGHQTRTRAPRVGSTAEAP